jgi:hypothetical protein
VFIPLSRDALRENLEAALEHRNDATAALSQSTVGPAGMVATDRGRIFAQGWDAPAHERRIFFYREKSNTSIAQ